MMESSARSRSTSLAKAVAAAERGRAVHSRLQLMRTRCAACTSLYQLSRKAVRDADLLVTALLVPGRDKERREDSDTRLLVRGDAASTAPAGTVESDTARAAAALKAAALSGRAKPTRLRLRLALVLSV
jgi:hypothetical protein